MGLNCAAYTYSYKMCDQESSIIQHYPKLGLRDSARNSVFSERVASVAYSVSRAKETVHRDESNRKRPKRSG